LIAAFVYLRVSALPWCQVGDIIAPGMALGLAIGRIGCLMNGCCFGGPCDADFPGLTFPAASPPYVQQLRYGQLIGIQGHPTGTRNLESEDFEIEVDRVAAGSQAESLGIKQGDKLKIYPPENLRLRALKEDGIAAEASALIIDWQGRRMNIAGPELPDRSLPTHPTQIYSSINAVLLCLVLWFYFPFRHSEGEVFGLMLILYPIGRFLLEMIRTDEQGIFGTPFTISQWMSMVTIVVGFTILVYVRGQGPMPKPAGQQNG
jgi:phosphatidylglycerol:prolipoprotein diacylglycerol transferase